MCDKLTILEMIVRGNPSILSNFSKCSRKKSEKSVAIGISHSVPVNNKKLLDGDLLLLVYSDTERPPRMVTLGTDPFDSFDP